MQLETEVENVKKELVKQQNRLLKPIWEKRKAILSKIPDFWLVAIGNHPVLAPLISYEDVEILNHLTSLHVDRNDDNPENYRITVTFSKNAYFKDTELVKTFKQSKDGESFASKTL
ncbi:hypothetical protein BC936DRAFT_140971 [Jimgerdemannia flammicorona]|uniref:Uncharacterized protein n=1 Tax=Jimgerdemannia flammicorona TaxID=994334 RepID=A0A433A344_9FUNG|nr:hypothetical protein BC936DRAFT_140971 [Jimgerdemannia flammicorona]